MTSDDIRGTLLDDRPPARDASPRPGRLGVRDRLDRLDRRNRSEAAVVVGLVVAGLLVRRSGLPVDGLAYDDSWVATGAKADVDEILTVSTNHPAFTALLMVWRRAVSVRTELLAIPAFVAGAVAAPLVYVLLRRRQVIWSISLLAAALLLVAPAHVVYSGRVKPYTIETVVVLVVALVIPWLAARRWTWSTVALWVMAALAAGSISAFSAMAVAVAAGILVLHSAGDRRERLTAFVVQGVLQGVYLARVQSSFESSRVAEQWETTYDGYIELEGSPWAFIRQVAGHLRRLGEALLDVGSVPALALVVVAVAGLAVSAARGPRRVVARYLLALLAVALVGGVVRQIPFGPSLANPAFPGGRASLWLLPSLAVGLAFALDLAARQLVGRGRAAIVAVHVAAIVVAGAVVIEAADDTPPYPLPGTRSTSEAIEAAAGPRDLVIVLPAGHYPFAAEPGRTVSFDARPESEIGFGGLFTDPRILAVGQAPRDLQPDRLRARVGAATRVFIHNGLPGFGDADLPMLRARLGQLGFRRESARVRGTTGLEVWVADRR